ncbi:MAG: hypothetical protein JWR19_2464 [Pedosphaera sp.]|jgi:hypothetical protein|nr:hypothetical protein [Pedosphaera sp.]
MSSDGKFTTLADYFHRARDDQGREFYAYPYDWDWNRPAESHYLYKTFNSEPLFLFLDLPTDAKTVDLTFCVHGPRIVDFTFKPPALFGHK